MMDQTFHQVGPTLEGVDWQYPLKIWFSARVIRPASSHVTCHMPHAWLGCHETRKTGSNRNRQIRSQK